MGEICKWLTLDWYRYLFRKQDHLDRDYCSWWERLLCRIRNHPAGTIYYNPNGFEPDNHCKNCGDDLGFWGRGLWLARLGYPRVLFDTPDILMATPQMKTQRDRRADIVAYRKSEMEKALAMDGHSCQSPFHRHWHGGEYAPLDPPHHLNSRHNHNRYDSVEWLITLCHWEHFLCENGSNAFDMTGREYEFCVLWALRDSDGFRWRQPLELIERKIDPQRIEQLKEKVKEVLG